jgi:hypothetical protein
LSEARAEPGGVTVFRLATTVPLRRRPPTPAPRFAKWRRSAPPDLPTRGRLDRDVSETVEDADYWPQTLEPVVQTYGTTTPVKHVV